MNVYGFLAAVSAVAIPWVEHGDDCQRCCTRKSALFLCPCTQNCAIESSINTETVGVITSNCFTLKVPASSLTEFFVASAGYESNQFRQGSHKCNGTLIPWLSTLSAQTHGDGIILTPPSSQPLRLLRDHVSYHHQIYLELQPR